MFTTLFFLFKNCQILLLLAFVPFSLKLIYISVLSSTWQFVFYFQFFFFRKWIKQNQTLMSIKRAIFFSSFLIYFSKKETVYKVGKKWKREGIPFLIALLVLYIITVFKYSVIFFFSSLCRIKNEKNLILTWLMKSLYKKKKIALKEIKIHE